jgi:hypothetical protein
MKTKLKKVATKLLNVFKVSGLQASDDMEGKLDNKKLLKELSRHFEMMLECESVGEKMLYPMSFNILMTPQDYMARKKALPFVFPEVVKAFYRIIERKRAEYPDYAPPARYWYFQVSQCELANTESGETKLLTPGQVTTIASLYTFDIRTANNVEVMQNANVSLRLEGSNRMENININLQALQNLDVVGDDIFTFDFNLELKPLEDGGATQPSSSGLARLEYKHNGQIIRYTMKSPLIHISGRKDARQGSCYFKLESDEVVNSHVQIKYQKEDDSFKIAAFGPTRLNSHKIDESEGGDVVWYSLANRSNIFINGEILVTFERL